MHGRGRNGACSTLAIGGALAALAATGASAVSAPPDAIGVRLSQPVNVRARPDLRAPAIARIETYTPATLRSAVFPVVKREASAAGVGWVKIRLPFRPNGSAGWIPARVTRPLVLHWRIAVSLHRRRATAYRDGAVVRRFRVVVGARSTPTPTGHFFVVERMRLHTSWARGLWALALSAHSNRLEHFDGGDGQVALHARGSLSARLGTAASHGCVRFADASIAWLARMVPAGTPVDIAP